MTFVFAWSLMGQDAGQPLDEIVIRKDAERRNGDGRIWWGGGTPLGARVESEAISNEGTLPAVFSPLENQKQALDPNTCVWNGYDSILTGVQGDIPPYNLVLGGNPDRPYYAQVFSCDTEFVLGDHGRFDPAQCLTLANGVRPGVSQRAALLKGQVKHPHGPYRIAVIGRLVRPWFVRLTRPRLLTAAELARVRQYRRGDDLLSLVKSLRRPPGRRRS